MAAKNRRRRMSDPVLPEEEVLEQEEEGGEDELSLDEVLRLGGTRADYILLSAVSDSNELVDGGKKGAIDDLEEGELQAFITKLGIRAYAEHQNIPDGPEDGSDGSDGPEDGGDPGGDEKVKGHQAAADEEPPTPQIKDKKPKKKKKEPGSSKTKQNQNLFEFQPRQFLLIRPRVKWFELEYASEGSSEPQDPVLVSRYQTLAQQLFESEVDLYRTKKNMQKGANSAWMKTVVSSGVLADRMAAMTVLVQDAPVHSLDHVETLVTLVSKKGGRRTGLMALDTLRDLLLSNLLPEHRKLRPFAQHPFQDLEERAGGNRDARDRRLVLWYFEDRLKGLAARFVEALSATARDTVPAVRTKALSSAYQLLSERPEQERALLGQVVNKLGDPAYKMAAKASHLLELLLRRHPNMKAAVCEEVERLLFRPNLGAKARYYAVCFLNQVVLSHEESGLAARLLALYFSFFQTCIKTGSVESKMLSALLSGVNRAYPYAGAGDQKVKEQLETLFRVVHLARFNTAVQALMLLFQVLDSQQSLSDRFYVTLYRKLLDPGLSGSSRQNLFLNLLYKSMKSDVAPRRVRAFIKRLLQVGAEQNPSFTCGALFLVSEVLKAKPGLKVLLQEAGVGEDEEDFKDLSEDMSDEEEKFVDADRTEDGSGPAGGKPTASWVHHQNLEGRRSSQNYDPLHRNPLFCGADHASLWELHRLAQNFHPSVALFAKTLLQGDSIQYSGDPLQDFTLIRFLDRFVFRNPKQLKGKQNTDSVVLRPKQRTPVNPLPVNCPEFLSRDESQIRVDEIFFHRFFKKRQQEKQSRQPRRDGDNESVEDVDDDEFEKVLDSAEGDSYFTDVAEDLDFAGNVKGKTGKKKGDESDMDDSDVDELDDEEVSLGSMDEEDFGDELEEEGGTFMDPNEDDDPELEEEEEEGDEQMDVPDVVPQSQKKKRKFSEQRNLSGSSGSTKGKKLKKGAAAMFASAEEFGLLLDENTNSRFSIGLNAMATSDKAGLKQLKWEAQRDAWIHGRDDKTLRRKKTSFNRRKAVGSARKFRKRK
ncbi:CCAAT/enhancer-binding protein zeta isoform X2 [Austrofundulus limnaeus]|uniref:CCAAT/enhancer-binding protein zeta n=1 Tax=Austrofundulus limnaeus TaxID=52670 RepID=A0A2I4CDN8_AUSLI|nr:PREDICTED: CCAAT/enhancer-binding protein zeta isoform X2 [Austrofundulus limnaeus]